MHNQNNDALSVSQSDTQTALWALASLYLNGVQFAVAWDWFGASSIYLVILTFAIFNVVFSHFVNRRHAQNYREHGTIHKNSSEITYYLVAGLCIAGLAAGFQLLGMLPYTSGLAWITATILLGYGFDDSKAYQKIYVDANGDYRLESNNLLLAVPDGETTDGNVMVLPSNGDDLAKPKKKNRRESGQGLVEYALILILVAVVVIVILALADEAGIDWSAIIKESDTTTELRVDDVTERAYDWLDDNAEYTVKADGIIALEEQLVCYTDDDGYITFWRCLENAEKSALKPEQ